VASVLITYLQQQMVDRNEVKVFIEGASPTQSKTMLSGIITQCDDECIVLDECLIFLDRVISIAPYHN